MCERKIYWLPLAHPQLGTWPTTQACTLTRNPTSDLLVFRLVLNPVSHSSQGKIIFILFYFYIFKDFYLFIFREREWRETSMCEIYINQLPLAHPQLGTWPATQACALTSNRTSYLFWFAGQCLTHWATPARANSHFK